MGRHKEVGPTLGGGRAIVVGAGVALLASLLVLVLSRGGDDFRNSRGLPTPPGTAASSQSAPTAGGSAPAGSPSAGLGGSSARPSDTARPANPKRPPVRPESVSAQHQLVHFRADGHTARVTVVNADFDPADWTVVLIVEQGVVVREHRVSGGGTAALSQQGTTVRISGQAGGRGTVVLEYDAERPRFVSGQPRSCVVNETPCG